MALYSAAELNEQVFQYLLQRHFRMKEAGEEFYFWLEPGIGGGVFSTNKQGIIVTFWDNYYSPGGEYLSPPLYWLNLSVSFDGNVFFWIPYPYDKKQMGSWESISKQIDLQSNEDEKRWEYVYSDTTPYHNKLDDFFSNDFDKIKRILQETFSFDKIEKKISERQRFVNLISLFKFEEMLNNTLLERNITHTRRIDWGRKSASTGILSFEFWNFRGIKHAKVEGIPADTKWIFLTGENGFGKSSILQGVALGLAGSKDLSKSELGENWLIAVEWFEKDTAGVSSLYGAQTIRAYEPKKNLAAYGSSRLQISGSTEPVRQNEGATLHLFNQNQTLLNIENELIRAQSYRGDQFKYIVEIIKNLIPDLDRIEVDTKGNYEEVLYFEKDREGGTYKPIKFNQLAAGFRNLIGFIGDMYLRLSAGQSGPVHPKELEGIVLIDEIELHLHPKYQKMLPGKLSEIFPKVQFIASTHSPIPLLGAPKETVILTVNRTPEDGITVENVGVDISTLLPNAILTSPVFGFDEILPAAATDIADVETADSYESAKEMQGLKQKLKMLKAKMNTN